MITCPWCGTNYETFQPNCMNCGGSLPLPDVTPKIPISADDVLEMPLAPPLPPRQIPKKVISRILLTDAGAIVGGVFVLIGLIFFVVGFGLVFSTITFPVGLPFLILGFIDLIVGGILFSWRYRFARRTFDILQDGQAALGEITNVAQSYHVRVNNRYPWVIHYRYKVHGKNFQGKLTTLSQPDLSQGAGKPVYVLYQFGEPEKSTLYPSPYGYYA